MELKKKLKIIIYQDNSMEKQKLQKKRMMTMTKWKK